MNRLIFAMLLASAFTPTPAFAASPRHSVTGTQHDLTGTGSGPVRSAVTDACLFCHAPHNITPNIVPLWDHTLPSQTYSLYTSSTYNAGAQTPGAGSSKLCLSCHDGTVAVGQTVAKGLIPTSGSMTAVDVLGANLAPSHPLSMVPVDDGQLASLLFTNPASTKDAAVHLVSGKVECTTCHDPHVQNNDPAVPMFLVRSNASGAICLACHEPSRGQPNALNGWSSGSHAAASNAVPTTAGFGPYGNVASNACSNCHGAHNNASTPRNSRAPEQAACSPCHNGANVSPPLPNVLAEFNKVYAHPTITVTGVHDPAESLPVNSARHAECSDCHNSHAAFAQTGVASAPGVQAALTGVSGWDANGAQRPAGREYQVCFKCHADSTNKPTTSIYGRTASRYPPGPLPAGYPIPPPMPPDQYNLRAKFTSGVGHNVMGNSIVTTTNTSLRPYMLYVDGATSNINRPLNTSTMLYCTDCHDNDQSRAWNGTGPNGPHASSFPHLLQLNLFQDALGGRGGGGGTNAAALCNKCHNLTTVRNERPHGDHSGVGCTTCHDPHGVIGGTAAANRAMMNFDTGIAAKATTYFGYFYNGAGNNQKGCYTTCHGENHNPHTY